ncbi:MAG TPA: gephyrin-like molybdotransferase Glp [Planctomicrobium sp.]|nr:gephyrin-like molybdotransferase Glp [Planctomicrobium sp.]
MLLTVEQAWDQIVAHVPPALPVRVPLMEAGGLVLAEEVLSTIDSPPFDKSMMDGYAVQRADLQSNPAELRVISEVSAGQVPERPVEPGTAIRIMTGAPIPEGADAVIPLEWTSEVDSLVTFHRGADARSRLNILPRGESMRVGETLFRAGDRVSPQTVAVLAETGHAFPLVRTAPTVAILATGDELVDTDQTPGPGQIRNTNAVMLAAQVAEAGAIPRILGIARDQRDDLRTRLLQGLESDVLVLSGGVSAGAYDLVPSELANADVQAIFHKISMKPGKPCWFGTRPRQDGKPPTLVFGLPGNPVSSMVCFELFVRLALRRLTEGEVTRPDLRTAELTVPFQHRGDRSTWFPSQVSSHAGRLVVQPAPWKGSADLRSTARANCSLCVPTGEIDWEPGREVTILPWGRTFSRIDET